MYDFDSWLENLIRQLLGHGPDKQLQILADRLKQDYGARVWFVRILGKRWSHVAGDLPEGPVDGCIQQIPLAKNYGMVIQTKGNLRETQFRLIKMLIDMKVLNSIDTDAQNRNCLFRYRGQMS